MRYLLDTHTLLWFLLLDENLPDSDKMIIENTEGIYVSVVSLWEIAIKQSIGKLIIGHSITEIGEKCVEKNIKILHITPEHLDIIKSLPDIHKDPFDRLIISQAMYENLSIITRDVNISKYSINTVW